MVNASSPQLITTHSITIQSYDGAAWKAELGSPSNHIPSPAMLMLLPNIRMPSCTLCTQPQPSQVLPCSCHTTLLTHPHKPSSTQQQSPQAPLHLCCTSLAIPFFLSSSSHLPAASRLSNHLKLATSYRLPNWLWLLEASRKLWGGACLTVHIPAGQQQLGLQGLPSPSDAVT